MQLRSLYRQDPTARKLVNEGVANVNDGTSSLARDVLRYELETFVCDGQYGSGMAHILDTYTPIPAEAEFDGLTAGLGTIQLCL
jgi:hypothetical protein